MIAPKSLVHVAVIFAVRTLGLLTAFALNFVVALKLPPNQAGLFFLGSTLITLLALSGRAGVDNLLIKRFSLESPHAKSEALKTYSFAIKKLGLILVLLSLFLLLFADYISSNVFDKPEFALTIKYYSPSIVFYGLTFINSQTLLGLRKTNSSIILSNVISPMLTAIIILFAGLDNSAAAALTFTCACFVSLLISFAILPFNPIDAIPIRSVYYWRQCFPFFWVSIFSLSILWSGQLLAGVYASTEEIARLTIAQRVSMLVSFPLLVVNAIYSPLFARTHHENNYKNLKRAAQQASAISIGISAPVLFICIAFPGHLMSFFGETYGEGANLLMVLVLGQIVNVSCGSVGQLLMMCGKEKTYRNMTILAGTASILLSLILTPLIGILGASIATSIAIAIQNIAAAMSIKSTFGFWVFPRFKTFLGKHSNL